MGHGRRRHLLPRRIRLRFVVMAVALCTIVTSVGGPAKPAAPAANYLATLATAVDYTTFVSDLATLVADGTTPTQGHVTSVNSDWTTLKAEIDALTTGASGAQTAAGHTVTVTFDVTDFADWGVFNAALRAIGVQAIAAGYLKV